MKPIYNKNIKWIRVKVGIDEGRRYCNTKAFFSKRSLLLQSEFFIGAGFYPRRTAKLET